MSSPKKTIIVFRATSIQGGSVIKSILSDPVASSRFHIRAVTRDVTRPKAKALAEQGCELISAELNRKEDLVKALSGAYRAFVVTNFWESGDAEVEVRQGKNVADAAKGALPGVAHFDSKARVESYIRSLSLTASVFRAGYYMSNLTSALHRNFTPPAAPSFTFAVPIPVTAPIPMFDAAVDTGKFVKAIFLTGAAALGRTFNAATAYMFPAEIVAQWAEVKGVEAHAVQVDHAVYKGAMVSAGMQEKVAEELLQNMRLMEEFGYYGGAKLEESQKV